MVFWIWENLGTCSLLESNTPEGAIIIDVRDIRDGKGNSIEDIKTKIVVIANLLSIGQKVIIRCIGGMSRSNTFACAVMTFMIQVHDWEYQMEKVKKKCPRAAPNLDLVDDIKKALEEMGVDRKRLYYD
jgi:protein-tyrosine phosphatase